jgi:starch phosphorylase
MFFPPVHKGYNPAAYYENNSMLRRIIDQISSGHFCPEEPNAFSVIVDTLLVHGDRFKLLADYQSYIDCQKRVSEVYMNQKQWVGCYSFFKVFENFNVLPRRKNC